MNQRVVLQRVIGLLYHLRMIKLLTCRGSSCATVHAHMLSYTHVCARSHACTCVRDTLHTCVCYVCYTCVPYLTHKCIKPHVKGMHNYTCVSTYVCTCTHACMHVCVMLLTSEQYCSFGIICIRSYSSKHQHIEHSS